MGVPAPTELLLILVIALFIFGPKKIPEIMEGMGKGIRTFKKTIDGDDAVPLSGGAPPAHAPSVEETKIGGPANEKTVPR